MFTTIFTVTITLVILLNKSVGCATLKKVKCPFHLVELKFYIVAMVNWDFRLKLFISLYLKWKITYVEKIYRNNFLLSNYVLQVKGDGVKWRHSALIPVSTITTLQQWSMCSKYNASVCHHITLCSHHMQVELSLMVWNSLMSCDQSHVHVLCCLSWSILATWVILEGSNTPLMHCRNCSWR